RRIQLFEIPLDMHGTRVVRNDSVPSTETKPPSPRNAHSVVGAVVAATRRRTSTGSTPSAPNRIGPAFDVVACDADGIRHGAPSLTSVDPRRRAPRATLASDAVSRPRVRYSRSTSTSGDV